jgi:hypothetical protein
VAQAAISAFSFILSLITAPFRPFGTDKLLNAKDKVIGQVQTSLSGILVTPINLAMVPFQAIGQVADVIFDPSRIRSINRFPKAVVVTTP